MYHRRAIIEQLPNENNSKSVEIVARELAFTEKVFEIDGKNYHAWAHSQWILSTYQVWTSELPFIESRLQEDIRNNSAWNQV
eukprot:gene40230-49752_t